MADFPSRSYDKGFPRGQDEAFLDHFSHLCPLPPQLKSWRLVQPRAELCSAAFSLLRKTRGQEQQVTLGNGNCGVNLPVELTKILTSVTCKDPPTTWNEATCSWPLLLPCGKECSVKESPLLGRLSRERFEDVDRYWSLEGLQTLAAEIRGSET